MIYYNAFGKPSLFKYCGYHYNISKTDGLLVCAISKAIVGIDCEKTKELTDDEMRLIYNVCESKEDDSNNRFRDAEDFYLFWTKKEAFLKYLGLGLSAIDRSKEDIVFMKKIQKFECDLKIDSGMSNDYVVSVCSTQNTYIKNVICLDKKTDLFFGGREWKQYKK